MTWLRRFMQSISDGSIGIKILNRFSRFQYVPEEDFSICQYLSTHYPGDGWKTLSPRARKVWVQYAPLFERFPVKTMAYVGANVGNTALALHEAFPGLRLYLVEPAPSLFQKLLLNTSGHPNITCINMAAGSEEASSEMFVDERSGGSSILPYRSLALEEFPLLGKQITIEKIRVKPLDTILQDYQRPKVDALLMDVQGYEDEVLRGAVKTLEGCSVVISELSLQELYSRSSTFHSVYSFLEQKGFHLQYLWNPMVGTSLQIMQIDGVFVRE